MATTEKLVIIGSGPAGLTAAIYAARGGLDPLVITGKVFGGQPTVATIVDDYPGFPEGIEAPKLAQLFIKQAEKFGARFLRGQVEEADFSQKPFKLQVGGQILYAESVILALGSSPRWLGLASEQRLIGKGVSVCATCDGPFFKGKTVVVVGGGDAAMKEAYYLSKLAKEITIIHRRDELRAQEELQKQVKTRPNVKFLLNSEVIEILGEEKVTGVKVKNNKNGKVANLGTDGVFIAIGHQPDTEFLKGKVELDQRGYIVLKGATQTSVPGIFAAGDVADSRYRQIITAAASGAKAALDVEEYLDDLKK